MTNRLLALALVLISNNIFASHDHHHHNSHNMKTPAPIGIMGDHMHSKGSFMMSYINMSMKMDGIIKDSSDVSEDDYFSNSNYMMAPKTMERNVHMLGAMYGVSDKFTLMAMIPHISNQMTMIKKMGRSHIESDSTSIGDMRLTSLFKLSENEDSTFIMGVGLTLPTGEINQKKDGANLAYGMQIGSGSYALNFVSTYTRSVKSWQFGAQIDIKTYINENSNDYKKGNEYLSNIWIQNNLSTNLSSSLRISQRNIDPLESNESSVSQMSSTFNPNSQHGMRRFAYLGLSYNAFQTNRISFEIGKPIAQDLANYQLKSESMLILGLQKVF
jgi:hypothetical protein